MTQSVREVAPAGKWAVAELWTYIGWLLEKGSFQPAPSHQPSPTAWFDGLARSGLHVWSLRRRSPNFFAAREAVSWPKAEADGRRPRRRLSVELWPRAIRVRPKERPQPTRSVAAKGLGPSGVAPPAS